MIKKTRLLFLLTAVWLLPMPPAMAEAEHPSSTDETLQFLVKPPKRPPHKHSAHITITNNSLKTGWVLNKQCHYNLARVPALEVVFHKGGVRNLRISRADNIKKAWVEGSTVQLVDIGKNAVLCIYSETHTFKFDTLSGTYAWHGGPYMKRFLDGYFTMHLNLAVDYPYNKLRMLSMDPAALKSRAVSVDGHIRLDTMFVGRLDIHLKFRPVDKKSGIGWQ
ncbi:MAG: hypothetical protein BMS9Abin11_0687 [Gammaproteobacteria bacterium]|nr:MAG: hypothetical protein BMS9Abin11_0687 [Gammaproteobacteria bacterium]